jgi:hypothetical protein
MGIWRFAGAFTVAQRQNGKGCKTRPQNYITFLTSPTKHETLFIQIYKTAVYGCFSALKNPDAGSGFLD